MYSCCRHCIGFIVPGLLAACGANLKQAAAPGGNLAAQAAPAANVPGRILAFK